MIYRLPDKKPSETMKGLWFDFANHLLTGETISEATVDGDLAENVTISGTRVVWDATGGTDGQTARFVVTATGSMGSIRVEIAEMVING